MATTTAMKKDDNLKYSEGGTKSAGGVLENVQDFASDTMDKAKGIADDVVSDVKHVAANLPETIRRYPMESILVGFGAGFLVAFLGGRLFTSRT